MRDLGEHASDRADTGADRPDGHARPSQPRLDIPQDTAVRAARAISYRERVYAEYAACGTKHPRSRGTQAEPVPAGNGSRDHASPPLTPRDKAERMTRDVRLPADTRDLPDAPKILPNLHLAELDRRKFSDYSLNPGHPHNGGKAEGWRALGYDVDSPQARCEAADDLREMIRGELLARGKVTQNGHLVSRVRV